ncbi:MAG: hypothetical protein QME96_02570 [Myxococcota bacterium]|nr:hypothetical protein [Myxococcota bacterium]
MMRSIVRPALLVLLVTCGARAPMQCPSDDRPASRTEADAAEELYRFAGRSLDRGDAAGWRAALEYLVERFGDSRFAAAARVDIEECEARQGQCGR